MGWFDNIKKLFKKNNTKLLLEKNNEIDIDRTQEMVTLQTVEAILKDKKVFKKFLNFKDNLDFFNTTENSYIDFVSAINSYAKYKLENGQRISKLELKRVKKISGVFPQINENSKEIMKNKELNDFVNRIIKDKDLFNEFIQSSDSAVYENLKKKDILDYVTKNIAPFYRKFNIDDINFLNRVNILEEIDRLQKNGFYRINANRKMNPDFEDSIMKSAQFSEDKIVMAFNIYNELNKRVKYSTAFSVLNQDLSNPIAEELYYKSIENISLEDNKLACKGWSEIYAYFLEKIGIPAYINSDTKHRTVTAIIDEMVVTADATNLIYNDKDKSMLNDITRAKLGILPAGFYVRGTSQAYTKKANEYRKLTINYQEEENIKYEHQAKVDTVLSLIGSDKEMVPEALDIKADDNAEQILKKLKFLKEMMDNSQMDNIDNIGYMKCIYRSIFTPEEMEYIGSSYKLYTKIDENYDCDILPLLSVKLSREGEENKYLYFIFEKEKGLHLIKKDQVIADLASGKLSKSNDILIPGFEELDEQISELRQREQNSVERDFDKNKINSGDAR